MTPTQLPITIMVADDHTAYRKGVISLLRDQHHIQVIGEASCGEELLQLLRFTQPHIVLTDIFMSHGMNGIELIQTISKLFPSIRTIGISYDNSEQKAMEVLNAGAHGFLSKDADKPDFVDAFVSVAVGRTYLRHQQVLLSNKINVSNFNTVTRPIRFSNRELQIIQLTCQQKCSKEIAQLVSGTPKSVEAAKERIREKIGARNVVGVVIHAIREGLYKIY